MVICVLEWMENIYSIQVLSRCIFFWRADMNRHFLLEPRPAPRRTGLSPHSQNKDELLREMLSHPQEVERRGWEKSKAYGDRRESQHTRAHRFLPRRCQRVAKVVTLPRPLRCAYFIAGCCPLRLAVVRRPPPWSAAHDTSADALRAFPTPPR